MGAKIRTIATTTTSTTTTTTTTKHQKQQQQQQQHFNTISLISLITCFWYFYNPRGLPAATGETVHQRCLLTKYSCYNTDRRERSLTISIIELWRSTGVWCILTQNLYNSMKMIVVEFYCFSFFKRCENISGKFKGCEIQPESFEGYENIHQISKG